ncbi:MAG: hypothetical protein J07HN4v3_00546 [Halonotius sp. J07HN4]|nr:MAG: hypothetical protein J07HN4v3_00546 [Halonotius sp. J07HN4]
MLYRGFGLLVSALTHQSVVNSLIAPTSSRWLIRSVKKLADIEFPPDPNTKIEYNLTYDLQNKFILFLSNELTITTLMPIFLLTLSEPMLVMAVCSPATLHWPTRRIQTHE